MVLLRAAILCFQTVAIGGILFLTIVARSTELRREELLRSAGGLFVGVGAWRWPISQFYLGLIGELRWSWLLLPRIFPAEQCSVRRELCLGRIVACWPALALACGQKSLKTSVNPLAMVPAACILAASTIPTGFIPRRVWKDG